MRFLIDECLSSALALLARRRGYPDAAHVTWIGKRGWQDWNLRDVILDGDWTFVTKNSADFRGPANARGSRGEYADIPLHAGLVCLNGPPTMDLDMQLVLFGLALDVLAADADLVNRVLEITFLDLERGVDVLRYSLPGE